VYFPILISKRGTPSEVRLLCRVSVSSLCTLRTFRSIGVRHPWTCCPLCSISSLLSVPSLVAPSSAASLRSREAFCSVLHRTSLHGPPLHGSRRSLVVREDGSWCRLRLIGSGSMLFGGGVDVSVVQYCWIRRFLTERDVRLSVMVILMDRWLFTHLPSAMARWL
jgi:hypothetical protein